MQFVGLLLLATAVSALSLMPRQTVDKTMFVDERDGKVYPTVLIGHRQWFARNLDFETHDNTSFCYADDSKNCEKFGRLYTFKAAKHACPLGSSVVFFRFFFVFPLFSAIYFILGIVGSRLGRDKDWKRLETRLGMDEEDLEKEGYSTVRGKREGKKLKKVDGFHALPAGYRFGTAEEGHYDALNDRTYFWTSTHRGKDVWRRRITVADPTIFRFTNIPDGYAISVRCVIKRHHKKSKI
jgi:uncharacterized protein (TIGR02145 family)